MCSVLAGALGARAYARYHSKVPFSCCVAMPPWVLYRPVFIDQDGSRLPSSDTMSRHVLQELALAVWGNLKVVSSCVRSFVRGVRFGGRVQI